MTMRGNGLKRLFKTGIAAGAHWSRLDRVIGSRRGLHQAPLVVGYHRVVEDFEYSSRNAMPSMLVSTKTLELQLDWIGKRYRFVSLDELARQAELSGRGGSTAAGDKPLAAVTFDDGYQDVYKNAFPLLQRKGIPFTAYVVTDLVGTDRLLLHDEVYLLLSAIMAMDPGARAECWNVLNESFGQDSDRPARLFRDMDKQKDAYRATRLMLHGLSARELRHSLEVLRPLVTLDKDQRKEFLSMDWQMLRELVQGGCTIGSHTRSHALLASESEAATRDELEGSRLKLEQHLGVPIRHLAYPDGSFNADTVKAANAAGYLTATTTCGHASERFPALTISRRLLWEKACNNVMGQFSPAILSCQVNGVFDTAGSCSYAH